MCVCVCVCVCVGCMRRCEGVCAQVRVCIVCVWVGVGVSVDTLSKPDGRDLSIQVECLGLRLVVDPQDLIRLQIQQHTSGRVCVGVCGCMCVWVCVWVYVCVSVCVNVWVCGRSMVVDPQDLIRL